jgi:Na+-driven multidrug efflux pump
MPSSFWIMCFCVLWGIGGISLGIVETVDANEWPMNSKIMGLFNIVFHFTIAYCSIVYYINDVYNIQRLVKSSFMISLALCIPPSIFNLISVFICIKYYEKLPLILKIGCSYWTILFICAIVGTLIVLLIQKIIEIRNRKETIGEKGSLLNHAQL